MKVEDIFDSIREAIRSPSSPPGVLETMRVLLSSIHDRINVEEFEAQGQRNLRKKEHNTEAHHLNASIVDTAALLKLNIDKGQMI